MRFNHFARLCRQDVAKYRENYATMLHVSGTIPSTTIGFVFDLNTPEGIQEFNEMHTLFQPLALWCGTKDMADKVNKLGHEATEFPLLEYDGFMVVLKTPALRKEKDTGYYEKNG